MDASSDTRLRRLAAEMERFDDVGSIVARTLWVGLVAGRWSIADCFDRDGRRFIVATKNEAGVPARALSDRQAEIVARAAIGCSLKEIASDLDLSPSTVSAHVSAAMRKLGMKSRVDLVRVIGTIAAAVRPR